MYRMSMKKNKTKQCSLKRKKKNERQSQDGLVAPEALAKNLRLKHHRSG